MTTKLQVAVLAFPVDRSLMGQPIGNHPRTDEVESGINERLTELAQRGATVLRVTFPLVGVGGVMAVIEYTEEA